MASKDDAHLLLLLNQGSSLRTNDKVPREMENDNHINGDSDMEPFIRIRTQDDGIFKDDEEDEELTSSVPIPEVKMKKIVVPLKIKRNRKQNLNLGKEEKKSLQKVKKQPKETGGSSRDSTTDDTVDSFEPKNRKPSRVPLYLLNPDDYVNEPKKQHQIRRAKSTYHFHLDRKGLIIKLSDENTKLREVMELIRAKAIELSKCGCKKISTADLSILDLKVPVVLTPTERKRVPSSPSVSNKTADILTKKFKNIASDDDIKPNITKSPSGNALAPKQTVAKSPPGLLPLNTFQPPPNANQPPPKPTQPAPNPTQSAPNATQSAPSPMSNDSVTTAVKVEKPSTSTSSASTKRKIVFAKRYNPSPSSDTSSVPAATAVAISKLLVTRGPPLNPNQLTPQQPTTSSLPTASQIVIANRMKPLEVNPNRPLSQLFQNQPRKPSSFHQHNKILLRISYGKDDDDDNDDDEDERKLLPATKSTTMMSSKNRRQSTSQNDVPAAKPRIPEPVPISIEDALDLNKYSDIIFEEAD